MPTWTPPPNAPTGHYAWGCVCGGPAAAGCPNCASILYWMLEDPNQSTISFLIVSITCRDNCGGTPTPGPTPGPAPTPVPDWPCVNEPPIVEGGIVRQPCSEWPGWYIDVEVAIPPAAAVVNPWPRSLCGLETSFWYMGASDVEQFSEEKALQCPAAHDGVVSDEATFDCGGGVGLVTSVARVNYQIGAAWRQWRRGEPAVFGWYPLDEAVWSIPDREWNGGTQTFAAGRGERVGYTFETSSWMPNPNMTPGQEDYCEEHDCVSGLGWDGPQWNTYCQDHDCRCEERVVDPLGAMAYHVTLNTFWWPEYTFRYDEFFCSHSEWGPCFGPGNEPLGQPHRGCGECESPGCWQIEVCDEWRWRNVTGPLDCTTVNPRTGWCMYDLRKLGADPLVGSAKVITAGAHVDGTRCGQGGSDCCPWYDNWPYYVPVPVIEIQPGGPGWADRE